MKLLILLLVLTSFITVYAKGEDYMVYKVVFNIEGELLEFDVKEGDTVGSVKMPIKEGYEFIGWFKNGILYDFALPVTSDMELMAGFKLIEEVEEDDKADNNLIIGLILITTGAAAIPLLYLFKKQNQIDF